MQSSARSLAGLLTRRTHACRAGLSPKSRFFTSSPQSFGSGPITGKRPKPTAMDPFTIARQSIRRCGAWQRPHRFQSTRRMANVIIGMNLVVYGAWVYADSFKDLKLQKLLMDNATLSWYNARAKRYWTLVMSAFSHKDFTHILFNMVSFNTFASILCIAGGVGVGPVHIWTLTLGSAVAGGASWLYQKKPEGRDWRWGSWGEHSLAAMQIGLGASGVVQAFAAAATCLAPTMRLMIMPIPIPIPMFILTGGFIAMDWFYLNANDHVGRSAHLGGAAFGVAYYLAALRGYGGVARLLSRGRF